MSRKHSYKPTTGECSPAVIHYLRMWGMTRLYVVSLLFLFDRSPPTLRRLEFQIPHSAIHFWARKKNNWDFYTVCNKHIFKALGWGWRWDHFLELLIATTLTLFFMLPVQLRTKTICLSSSQPQPFNFFF